MTIDGQDPSARRALHGGGDAESRSSSRAPIRCPRPSSTASCSRSSSTIPAATRSARSCAATAIAPPCRGWRISAWSPSPTAPTLVEMRRGRRGHPAHRCPGRLHRRSRAGDARACLAGGRRLDAGGQYAGRRRARLRRAPGPRLRHSRRHQDPGAAGAAPPAGAVARAPRSKAWAPTGCCARSSTGGGAAMIRPTRRAVLLFALGVPFAFLLVISTRRCGSSASTSGRWS